MFDYSLHDATGGRVMSTGRAEALPGETLTIIPSGTPIATIEVLDQPGGQAADVDGLTLTVHELGLHHVRVYSAVDGDSADLFVLVCEPQCFARMPDQQRSGGARVDKRLMLRSLSLHAPWFTGRAADIVGKNLTPFGA